MTNLLNLIGDWNPQLFRELKGRFNRRNWAIAVGASLFTQLLLLLSYLGSLPDSLETSYPYSRYCTGNLEEYSVVRECLRSSPAADWLINWQLWNFDLFIALSITGIGILLIIGSHLINADLTKEEHRGTLGFVRLSPQPAQKIILGKILGVPSLIYVGIALALPLHFFVGLQAHIAVPWIAMVDFVAIAACFTCFSVAALWSFIGQEFFGGFQAWLYSGSLGFYLMIMTIVSFENNLPSDTPFDWLRMVYPGNIFYYLVQQNSLADELFNYFSPSNWFETQFYGSTHWTAGLLGLGFMLGHYAFISFVAWQGIGRRFYNPNTTVISKTTGYGIAIIASILATGFTVVGDRPYRIFSNFEALQVFNFVLIIGLALLMTPPRQQVQDWMRFRHQGKFARRLWADLLWGDRSPAIVAIAVMIISSASIMAIAALQHPFLENKNAVIGGLMLQCGILFVFASLIQLILLRKKQRGIWLIVSIGSLTVLPFLVFVILSERFTGAIFLGLFSTFPITAAERAFANMVAWSLLGQCLGVIGSVVILQKQIRRLGDSEVKTLLTAAAETPENMLT